VKEPILITGCARSGTSMTAGILSLCGAVGGDMFGATRFNPRGMFENKIIREGVTKNYLRSIGADPLGQKPLPDMKRVYQDATNPKFVYQWRDTVQGIAKAQGMGDDEPWFYKGAKMCLFWPIWHNAFPGAKWVVVRRTDSDIVSSCLRTNFMKAYSTAEGWQGWVDVHKRRFEEMKSTGLRVFEVWPEKAIQGDLTGVYSMLEWLQLEPHPELITKFIDPVLWGKRK